MPGAEWPYPGSPDTDAPADALAYGGEVDTGAYNIPVVIEDQLAPPADEAAAGTSTRALLTELLNRPASEVSAALGVKPAVVADVGEPHPDQRLADDTAAGLAQLAWIVRRHPWLAPALRWEITGLAPQMIVSWTDRDAVEATAATVGARVSAARFDSEAPDVAVRVVELGEGSVRLLLTSMRPPSPQPRPSAPASL